MKIRDRLTGFGKLLWILQIIKYDSVRTIECFIGMIGKSFGWHAKPYQTNKPTVLGCLEKTKDRAISCTARLLLHHVFVRSIGVRFNDDESGPTDIRTGSYWLLYFCFAFESTSASTAKCYLTKIVKGVSYSEGKEDVNVQRNWVITKRFSKQSDNGGTKGISMKR